MLQDQTPVGHDDGPLLRAYASVVGLLCKLGMAIASVLILMDLLLIGGAVLLRYVFSSPIVGGDELVAFTLTAIVMLAAPDVLRKNGHIGVDILVGMLSPRWARWAAIWSSVSVILVAALLIINGWKAVALSHMIGSLTEGHLELPVWTLQLFLPLGGVLLGLVALEMIWRALAGSATPNEPVGDAL
ncbi:TRAP transporter small permease subunit [Pusillimonas sp. MFBS29]|uniref:TRAP transporter small permease n=1 Tax=Pusillimonas sp. MFBS29 TaxID=2886690 RepID=UPI001D0FD712|nr:TRAP transporter small permease subunit [Pusillimonas sp. MFBS29]MCC2594744.1 TRAP transporter small permease subunit [Pusillimonas sp. MFBS29]